jgi:hypothetical protein
MLSMMTNPIFPSWIPVTTLSLLLFISTVLSVKSGWHRIAKRFPHQAQTDYQKFLFVRMSLGSGLFPVAYGGAAFVRLCPNGLGISVIFLLRFLHPPMFLPWSAVTRCVRGKSPYYDFTKLSLRDEESEFAFYGRPGECIYSSYVSKEKNEKAQLQSGGGG